MKIQLVSPNYPPQKCGVGDYTFNLSEAMVNKGIETTIFTRDEMPRLGKANLNRISLFAKDPGDADTVTLIQYTPQLFKSLFSVLKILISARGKVSIYFHELYYPPSLSLRGLLIGVPHWIRYVILLHLADRAFFSTAGFYRKWKSIFPYRSHKMRWVPVGSNIPVFNANSGAKNELIKSATFKLLHFGGAHPTHLYDYIFEAFAQLLREKSETKYELVLVGVKKESIEATLAQFPNLKDHPQILYRGYLSVEEVSIAIADSDLVLAPFMDGVTTRRGSLIAALAHGKLVVTTFASGADTQTLPWSDFLVGADLDSDGARSNFTKKVLEWVAVAPEQRRAMELKAREAYLRYFSWDVIAQNLINIK